MSELHNNVRDVIDGIYKNALRDGYVNDDDICDELGDYFDDVQDSGDKTLKQAYKTARSAIDMDYDAGLAKLRAALDLLAA